MASSQVMHDLASFLDTSHTESRNVVVEVFHIEAAYSHKFEMGTMAGDPHPSTGDPKFTRVFDLNVSSTTFTSVMWYHPGIVEC